MAAAGYFLADESDRSTNAFRVILKGLKMTLRTYMDIENGLTGIDTDIDFTFVLSVHELFELYLTSFVTLPLVTGLTGTRHASSCYKRPLEANQRWAPIYPFS